MIIETLNFLVGGNCQGCLTLFNTKLEGLRYPEVFMDEKTCMEFYMHAMDDVLGSARFYVKQPQRGGSNTKPGDHNNSKYHDL